MPEVSIHKATPEDADLMLPLLQGIMDEHARLDRSFFQSYADAGTDRVREQITATIHDAHAATFYAKKGDAVIGYITGRIAKPRPAEKGVAVGKITDLFVSPESRKKGVGTKLHESILNWFLQNGISRVELNVYTKNAQAQRIWEKMGYTEFSQWMFKNI